MAWPDYYPHDVPPTAAVDAAGIAYRIVRQLPPAAQDFRSTYEEWTERGRVIPVEIMWLACGTSFHSALEGSITTRARFKPLRGRPIVVGKLVAANGKMLPTPSDHESHFTVWFFLGMTPEQAFTQNAEAT